MSTDLLLTLGHNSSAIAIVDGKIINAYEEERLSGKKSDSRFPINAITRLGYLRYDNVYVTHWEPFGQLDRMSLKHWQPDMVPVYDKLHTLSQEFTHHDSHMMSARAFLGRDNILMPSAWTIVADGFGNFGEVISIYDADGILAPSDRDWET
jgi:predicted NodU family carbamoyl transferase